MRFMSSTGVVFFWNGRLQCGLLDASSSPELTTTAAPLRLFADDDFGVGRGVALPLVFLPLAL